VTDKYQFILHIHGPDIERDLTLQVGTTMVGRDLGNSLVFTDPNISRRHAQFDCTDKGARSLTSAAPEGHSLTMS